MVDRSQNGWPAIGSYDDPVLLHNPTVPGSAAKLLGGVRSGWTGVALLRVAADFHANVENLHQEDGCWGYEPRVIRGSTELSNHASGTAIDLNAVRHPMGQEGTFGPDQRSKIRALLGVHQGRIRWGGDYDGRKDEMHFEIAAGTRPPDGPLPPVHPPVPPRPPAPPGPHPFPLPPGYYFGPRNGPTESISGMAGESPAWVAGLVIAQRQLIAHGPPGLPRFGADGKYGADASGETHDAVVAFQRQRHLSVDGLIGPVTWRTLWT